MLYLALSVFFSFVFAWDTSVSDENLAPDWKLRAYRGGSVDLPNPRPLNSNGELRPLIKKTHRSQIIEYSSTVDIQILSSNITSNGVNPWVLGVNYPGDGNFDVSYPVGRWGGNRQSSYNWNIDASSGAGDWFYITSGATPGWKELATEVTQAGMDLMIQIPAMGWVSKQTEKCWSFSVSKYGQQQATECTASNYATWCAADAGNGILTNGNQVTGNDPTDSMMQSDVSEGGAWAKAVNQQFGNQGMSFMIGNEPTLWFANHFDVRPDGITYDQLVNTTVAYGSNIKSTCGDDCVVYGYSPWGWCGYWTSGADKEAGGCTDGNDRQNHGGMPLAAYYLQQLKAYEDVNNQRVLDVLDYHCYPYGDNVAFSDDEDDQTAYNRLQSTRGLWDWSYVDDSWVNGVLATIPRFKNWISEYYPGTGLSCSEYNWGNDDIITSAIAHAEIVSIFASFNMTAGNRWVKPDSGSLVQDAYQLYINYDNTNTNVFDTNRKTIAMNTTTSDIETTTSWAFYNGNTNIFYITLFNKATQDTHINVNTGSYSVPSNGGQVYGFDSQHRLSSFGQVTNISSNAFSIDMPSWSVRMVVFPQS